jgi:hypothetical protein
LAARGGTRLIVTMIDLLADELVFATADHNHQ